MRKTLLQLKLKVDHLKISKLIMVMIFTLVSFSLFAQRTVKGIVTDNNGEPLIGVNVIVKGTNTGTVTDQDGDYSLSVSSNDAVLVFSYIGYHSIEIVVGNQSMINQVLMEDTHLIDELVVVGYGVQKKETATGAVSSVRGDDLIKSPVANLSNAIAGRMPGVITLQRSGEPGYDGATIRIRGSNTLGNNDPLVVIDGIAARAGGLERLDPNEIETISVLKDASSAIYGARAANGVILITTKKGKRGDGKPELSYSFNQGWATPTTVPKMSNSAEYAQLRNELIVNDGLVNPATGKPNIVSEPWKTDEEIQNYKNGTNPWLYPNTDWFSETLKPWSPQSVHNVELSGGSDKFQYFSNFGYKFQDGLYRNSANNYNQYNLRINLDAQLNDWIKASIGLMGRQENRNFPSQGAGDVFWFVARGRPTDPAYWPNGKPGPAQEYGRNPVVAVTDQTGYTKDRRYYMQTTGQVQITQPWIEGLKFVGNISYDKSFGQTKSWFQPWYLYTWDYKTYESDGVTPLLQKSLSYPSHSDPSLNMNSFDQTNMVLGGYLNYGREFGNHNVEAIVGTERDTSDKQYFNGYRRYFLSNSLQNFNAGGDKEKSSGSGGWNDNWERARMNYFGRFGYNYLEKYLAEFVWRYDGSYMFPSNNRFGFFPGVLLGYRISEEPFWKENVSWIDYLKIRGSWGQMGNDQVWFDGRLQEYQYLSTYYYEWGYIVDNLDEKGLRISRFPNTNITWERANNLNVGIEGRTINSKLYFEFDAFKNKRSNILWRRNASIPQTAGLTLPAENIGKVNNSGFDWKLEWNDIVSRDFRFNISFSGGYAKNKIIFWDESAGAPEWQKSTGYSMNTGLYYEFDGVFKDWEEINNKAGRPNYDGITSDEGLQPGDMKFKDIDGDGKITPDDRRRFDRTNEPKWTFGLNSYFKYKDFDLSILFQGAADSWTKLYFDSGEIGNYSKYVYDNHWSVDNPSSDHPRVHARGKYYWDSGTGANNTYWMQKTDYLRLKNIEIGYTFPSTFVQQSKFFSNARVYLNAVNLFTITDAHDIDPESTSSNATYYPLSKVINVGFTITF